MAEADTCGRLAPEAKVSLLFVRRKTNHPKKRKEKQESNEVRRVEQLRRTTQFSCERKITAVYNYDVIGIV